MSTVTKYRQFTSNTLCRDTDIQIKAYKDILMGNVSDSIWWRLIMGLKICHIYTRLGLNCTVQTRTDGVFSMMVITDFG